MASARCSVALKPCSTRRTLSLILRLVPCANEYPLPRFHIFNAVLAGPYLPKFSYTCFRIVEGWQCLDEVQVAIALQLEDAKGQAHPNSERGPTLRRDSWSDYHTDVKSQALLPPASALVMGKERGQKYRVGTIGMAGTFCRNLRRRRTIWVSQLTLGDAMRPPLPSNTSRPFNLSPRGRLRKPPPPSR